MAATLKKLVASLKGGGKSAKIKGLRGSSPAYVISKLSEELKRPILVITQGGSEAKALYYELNFFLKTPDEQTALPWDAPAVHFPAWDATVFEDLPPHPELSSIRNAALFRAIHGGPFVMVAPLEATFQRLAPPKALDAYSLTFSAGDEIDRDTMVQKLVNAGYTRVGQVEERGEVAVRGSIVDIYAPHYEKPLRVELYGDEIESIRTFEPATQRSLEKLDSAVVIPAREVLVGDEEYKAGLLRLRQRCHKLGLNLTLTSEALEPYKIDPFTPLRECKLAYFYDKTSTVFDYLPPGALVILAGSHEVFALADSLDDDLLRGFEKAVEAGRVTPEPADAYLNRTEWTKAVESLSVLEVESQGYEDENPQTLDFEIKGNEDLSASLKLSKGIERLLGPLVNRVNADKKDGFAVNIVCRTRAFSARLKDLVYEYGLMLGDDEPFHDHMASEGGKVVLSHGELGRGFRWPEGRLTVITDTEIFGRKAKKSEPKRGLLRSALADMSVGDLVVHVDFGIGRYMGMIRLTVEDVEGDYLHLEYADKHRLYLPVTRLNLVQKYAAPGGRDVPLDKLGGKNWEKAKKKAREGIEKMAHELLDLYARRAMGHRLPYHDIDIFYREFEATFPFEETRDQARAIDEVQKDMGSGKPMDRLICGDVGYGKTEVAIRAAFRAVTSGRQVAVLTPTTVLSAQHYQNFKKRFERYPLTVEMMSRFVDKASQAEIAKRIAEGKVDVVIGTHRLLSSDVKFKNLGLVVVDEEHRFGVAQKEKLKKIRTSVDMLALSATPIPRTLQMGFHGVRDLSVIETPPAERLAIRTRLGRFDDGVVKEAVMRELNRGGQVFFVHNRVQSIFELAEHLRGLMPGVRFGLGHGQMKETELQKVMEDFSSGAVDVLICTAIIESGLDIPKANTIIIDRADLFGLADLYQLRGRVGRSNVQAYCWLLAPEERELTDDARKRLTALQQFTELGSGFKVAMHDLEIRGAGELLGKNQSGNINALGFDLYAELLDEAVSTLRGEPHGRPPEPDIRLKIPAHFPESYVDDPRVRLALYERLTHMATEEELSDSAYELVDRFGEPPQEVRNLVETMKLRLRLMALRAVSLGYTGEELVLGFDENPTVDPGRIIELVTKHPKKMRLTPDGKVKFAVGKLESAELFSKAGDFLGMFA